MPPSRNPLSLFKTTAGAGPSQPPSRPNAHCRLLWIFSRRSSNPPPGRSPLRFSSSAARALSRLAVSLTPFILSFLVGSLCYIFLKIFELEVSDIIFTFY
ncbi:Uncharacterized protein M6B38_222610 [Iris pallida]|uniref:Uncharacterized protein n=1 Tax=Iris pallida TaxID=29817 RepID=A0AAX6DWU0_IRIPA|nr:Uncharacterized protein M6B38_222610 [Iris pallida]